LKFDPEVNSICEFIQLNPIPEATRDYAFTHAIEFYNREKFFEAHEIFEFQWKKEKGYAKLFLQSLIQISISMNKVFVNINKKGALSQATLALDKLIRLQECDGFSKEENLLFDPLKQNLKRLIELLKNDLEINDYLPPALDKNLLSLVMKNL
jgi:uncharacterized protein